jgi:electron transfer flavoprotein-quinone oxidoreductase
MADDQVKVDAIVVGGGPAGLAAAYSLAKQDVSVIVVERGEYAGSKNVGGLLYGTVLQQLIPKFWEQAPIERPVVKREIVFLDQQRHFRVGFGSESWGQPPYNYTYTVHRSQFDRWFAKQVEEVGGSLLEGAVVDGLSYAGEGKERKATGVKLRGDEALQADVVLLCDGANSLVTRQVIKDLAMHEGGAQQHYAVGIKEIIKLPAATIEDRFGLAPGEGAAIDFIGVPFEGLIGGGFMYTEKDTISLGFAAKIETLLKAKMKPADVMDAFKRHPVVRNYLRGGELVEYSAHMIPEGGHHCVPQLAANGAVICGDAAGLVNMSLYKEGTNHAMESGVLAAEAVVKAKQANDFSRRTLRFYEEKMYASVAMRDLEKYKLLPEIMDTTPEVLSLYPAKVTRLLVDYFTVTPGETKAAIQKQAIRTFFQDLPKVKFVRDLIRARKLM